MKTQKQGEGSRSLSSELPGMIAGRLFPGGEFGRVFGEARATGRESAAAGLDAEALDFLVQGGERDLKALGRFGLVPVGALEHVDYYAALYFFQDLE